jgi:biopolymer transport protein ExbD
LHGQPTPLNELQRLMAAAVKQNPTNQTVVIRADYRTSFQPVVSVMDLCNQTGISSYSVTTHQDSSGN